MMKKIHVLLLLLLLPVYQLNADDYNASVQNDNIRELSVSIGNTDQTLEFVWIAPGSFMMGARIDEDESGDDSERPRHEVKFAEGFWMGKHEITQSIWESVMGTNPSYFNGENLPVEQVSWFETKIFIDKLNELDPGEVYRLPTEAEWEYVCRAGTTSKYYTGDSPESINITSWNATNSDNTTHPVGLLEPNQFGVYDMYGNVWEWCEDDWQDGYTDVAVDGSPNILEPRSHLRIVRGSSWYCHPVFCRSAFRGDYFAKYGSNYGGFRLVLRHD